MTIPSNLPSLKQVLQAHGIYANKSLGQHFLLDMNITTKIAKLAINESNNNQTIIEIGPGPGGLSRALLANSQAQIIAVEMDKRFIPILHEIDNVFGRLQIINADAIKTDLAALSPQRPLQICANLPYNIGTKLLINWLLARPLFWDKMVLMLQREVAERITAKPNTAHYGRLSVLANSIAKTRIAFTLPPQAFTPPPKVESAVIVINALDKKQRFPDLQTLGQITAASFGQRRKMLRASLKPFAKKHNIDLEDWLEAAGIDGKKRPQTLEIKDFHRMVEKFIVALKL